jgi:hypothetical protein
MPLAFQVGLTRQLDGLSQRCAEWRYLIAVKDNGSRMPSPGGIGVDRRLFLNNFLAR